MDFIASHSLWIGHAGDGRNVRAICNRGIEAVLQLATEEPSLVLPREILQFRIPIFDGEGNERSRLRLAVKVLSHLIESRVPTLVCCSARASRSPAIAALAIAQLEKRTPQESLKFIREHHPTDVSPGLWNELLTCFTEDR
ncbi:protein tyrosine phosphatase [Thalassoglobus sp. JC818]|uniref:protein tyrosine phosphatase n=1 Tax=Thalassoglobus sp. JC818 TaxID=3232136 RepID=UPI00345A85DE